MTIRRSFVSVRRSFNNRSIAVRWSFVSVRRAFISVRWPFNNHSIRVDALYYSVILYHAKLHGNMHTLVLRRVFSKVLMIRSYSKVLYRDDCLLTKLRHDDINIIYYAELHGNAHTFVLRRALIWWWRHISTIKPRAETSLPRHKVVDSARVAKWVSKS